MSVLIGFNLIAFAITSFLVLLNGYELSTKDKLFFVAFEAVLLGILSTGIYLVFWEV